MAQEDPRTRKGTKQGDINVSETVEKLLKKKEEARVDNFLGIVKNSGIIEVFSDNIKRKYKLK